MYVTPSAPQSIGGVIDDAIRLYRHSFSRCWLLAFVASATYGAFMVAMALSVPHATTGSASPGVLAAQQAFARTMIGYVAVVSVVMIAFQGAITARQAAISRGDDSVSLARALATGFARLPLFILSAMLFYLGIVGGAIVVVVVALPFGWILNHQHMLVRPVLTAVIVMALTISMLYLMGRLQLFMVAMFGDRKGPLAAVTTSWRLTKGHWWRSMGILCAAMAIILVLFIALALVSDLIALLTRFGTSYRLVAAPLVVAASYTFMFPMGPALWVAMYNDFKLRREGGDLVARVGALTST